MPQWKGPALLNSIPMSTPTTTQSGARGRPSATSHGEIERAAFRLFAERGFGGTTLEDIAREVGVGRRTLFRYYASKNDIPWGQFSRTLEGFARLLEDMPAELPVHEAVHRGVLAFNTFPSEASVAHRERMHLILATPELQAHSVLQYQAWRSVIARYVARRIGLGERDVLPRLAGHVSLALALTAYEIWLADEETVLLDVLDRAMGELRHYLT